MALCLWCIKVTFTIFNRCGHQFGLLYYQEGKIRIPLTSLTGHILVPQSLVFYNVLYIILCLFVLFRLAIVLSVLWYIALVTFTFGHCIVCLLVYSFGNFFFWPLYCLSFDLWLWYIFLLAIVLSVL